MKYKIKKENQGERLDKFLAAKLNNQSRSQIQKLIKAGSVKLNELTAAAHSFLKAGDIVELIKERKLELSKVAKGSKASSLNSELFLKIKIIEDNPEFLVVNKPAGLIVHSGLGIKELTLVDWLLKKYPILKKIGENPERPGIVHRLDREASGLMVVAKTADSFDNLKEQFKKREIVKEYLALVYGRIHREAGEINFPIKRSSAGYRMAAMPETDKKSEIINNIDLAGVRRAITSFKILKRFINFTFLKVKIKTGRTHQIRVHMNAFGHPLVGDNLYSTKRTRILNRKYNLGRIFLVAAKLSFNDLAGGKCSFEINLPEELEKFLNKAK